MPYQYFDKINKAIEYLIRGWFQGGRSAIVHSTNGYKMMRITNDGRFQIWDSYLKKPFSKPTNRIAESQRIMKEVGQWLTMSIVQKPDRA